jgi:hypothetical protein
MNGAGHERDVKCIQNCDQKICSREDYLIDLGVNRGIILMWILREIWHEVDWIQLV